MQTFSGYDYILIDIANQFGLDKETFETRLQWANDNLNILESLADQADTKPLYLKGVMALRKAQAGIPTGHMIGMDACSSGIQIMSTLTGCVAGATATGLVDPTVRADAYGKLTEMMRAVLGVTMTAVSRADAKQALMTTFYGSRDEPKAIFGEDTVEIAAFYQAATTMAPGAWELLQDLLGSWQPFALSHSWKLPDGFDARVKVMTKVDKENSRSRVEVDELDHATFTYEFYENVGSKSGLSNAANVVHSIDAYVVRSIQRRCNYSVDAIGRGALLIEIEMIGRKLGKRDEMFDPDGNVSYYINQYDRSGMADVVIVPHLDANNIAGLSDQHLDALATIVNHMLTYRPFSVVTVHDEFKCGPNHMNHLRQQYINIFAELAESRLLDDLLSQLHGTPGTFTKLSNNLGALIRGSNYALS
jgi:hypothetical protein